MRPFSGKGKGYGAANATVAPGDHRYFPLQAAACLRLFLRNGQGLHFCFYAGLPALMLRGPDVFFGL